MIPYSIPLWTIFTKWPAPFGPQCRYPYSAELSDSLRPGVRGMSPMPGGKCCEDRIEMLDHIGLATNHHAVATLKSPYAATRTDINVMDLFRCQFLRAPNVVNVI